MMTSKVHIVMTLVPNIMDRRANVVGTLEVQDQGQTGRCRFGAFMESGPWTCSTKNLGPKHLKKGTILGTFEV